jgi:hypothetical protein
MHLMGSLCVLSGVAEPKRAKPYEELEAELLRALEVARQEFLTAEDNPEELDRVRLKYMNALNTFKDLVLHGKRPDDR